MCDRLPQQRGRCVFSQPTRLWVFSDLHQEHASNAWSPVAPPGGFDAIVAAGDVAQQLPNALRWLHDHFPGVPTIYVPGNHDLWNFPGGPNRPWTDILSEGRDLAARWGIHLLSDDTVVIGGTRFVGATLWTDFRFDQVHVYAGLASAKRGFNDFRRIRRPSGSTPRGRPIQPAAIFDLHIQSRTYIDATLAIPHDGPTVVVTHHAPHPDVLGLRPRDGLDHCYVSDLGWLIEKHQPTLWVHGHVHGRVDSRVGNTRLVGNARGHVEESSARDFNPGLVVGV